MNEKYKDVVLPGRIEIVYTILRTYERYDGEIVAEYRMVANNIAISGFVENDCGIYDGRPLSFFKRLERIN